MDNAVELLTNYGFTKITGDFWEYTNAHFSICVTLYDKQWCIHVDNDGRPAHDFGDFSEFGLERLETLIVFNM